MTLKILSGRLQPKSDSLKRGRATIDFSTHEVSGDAKGYDTRQIGPDTAFKKPPNKSLALREISTSSWDSGSSGDGNLMKQAWKVNDSSPDGERTERLEVEWETPQNFDPEGGPEIHEISYMIIGEADEPC